MSDKYIQPIRMRRSFGRRVLAVSVPRKDYEGQGWTAMVDAVPGDSHDHEWGWVEAYGAKLEKDIACVLFPGFNPEHYCA